MLAPPPPLVSPAYPQQPFPLLPLTIHPDLRSSDPASSTLQVPSGPLLPPPANPGAPLPPVTSASSDPAAPVQPGPDPVSSATVSPAVFVPVQPASAPSAPFPPLPAQAGGASRPSPRISAASGHLPSYAQATKSSRGPGFVRSHANEVEAFARIPRTGVKIITGSRAGMPSFSFVKADLAKVEDLYSMALVIKFLGGRPSLETSRKEIISWGVNSSFSIGPLSSRSFLLRFQVESDLLTVLSRPSSTLINFPYKVFRWHNRCHMNADSCVAPVWISLPRLPLQCFVPEFLESVANSFGRFLCLDKATATLARPSVARICVQLDLRNTPPQFIWIGLFEGFKQQILYDKVPKFCSGCFMQGHSNMECSRHRLDNPKSQALDRQPAINSRTQGVRSNAPESLAGSKGCNVFPSELESHVVAIPRDPITLQPASLCQVTVSGCLQPYAQVPHIASAALCSSPSKLQRATTSSSTIIHIQPPPVSPLQDATIPSTSANPISLHDSGPSSVAYHHSGPNQSYPMVIPPFPGLSADPPLSTTSAFPNPLIAPSSNDNLPLQMPFQASDFLLRTLSVRHIAPLPQFASVSSINDGVVDQAPQNCELQPAYSDFSKRNSKHKSVSFLEKQSNLTANKEFWEAVNRHQSVIDRVRLSSSSSISVPAPPSFPTSGNASTPPLAFAEDPSSSSMPVSVLVQPSSMIAPNPSPSEQTLVDSDSGSSLAADSQPVSPVFSNAKQQVFFGSEGDESPSEQCLFHGYFSGNNSTFVPKKTKRNKRHPDQPLQARLRSRRTRSKQHFDSS